MITSRKKIASLTLASTLGLLAGYLLTNSYKFGLCASDSQLRVYDVSCHQFFESLGNPLLYGMPALAFVFLALLLKPEAFKAWKKFAIWFVPLAAILFVFYPAPAPGDFFAPYPEEVYQWVSALYVLISLVIIAKETLKTRR